MDPNASASLRRTAFEVNGTRIAARYQPHRKAPLVVLVHGVAAHAGWWDCVVPHLRSHASVAVLDLSGHGESQHRDSYSADQWADEVVATIRHLGHTEAVVVGHSMGGRIGAVLAGRNPSLVRALVLLESNFRRPGTAAPGIRRGRAPKRFASRAEALEAFRLFPPETVASPDLVERIAEGSISCHHDGWGLKYDPSVFGSLSDVYIAHCLHRIRCPVTFAWSSRSPFVTEGAVDFFTHAVAAPTSVVLLQDCFHHVLLDDPASCADLIIQAIQTRV